MLWFYLEIKRNLKHIRIKVEHNASCLFVSDSSICSCFFIILNLIQFGKLIIWFIRTKFHTKTFHVWKKHTVRAIAVLWRWVRDIRNNITATRFWLASIETVEDLIFLSLIRLRAQQNINSSLVNSWCRFLDPLSLYMCVCVFISSLLFT